VRPGLLLVAALVAPPSPSSFVAHVPAVQCPLGVERGAGPSASVSVSAVGALFFHGCRAYPPLSLRLAAVVLSSWWSSVLFSSQQVHLFLLPLFELLFMFVDVFSRLGHVIFMLGLLLCADSFNLVADELFEVLQVFFNFVFGCQVVFLQMFGELFLCRGFRVGELSLHIGEVL